MGPYEALRGFVWVDASAKMPTWQRRHSLRACLPDQARGTSEGAPPARRGGRGTHAAWRSSRRDSCRDSRRNSVHKRPNPARRGHFRRSVYTPASPRLFARSSRVATVYTNAPKRIREAISIDLCTLLRRRPGGDAHAALAVTQPPTHTNSRSLPYDVVPLAVEVLLGDVEGARFLVGDPDPASYERGSTSRMTLRPLEVVVEATGPAITSSDPGGPPRQLRVIWVKMRCSTLFHFEVPGGRWRAPPPCSCGRRGAAARVPGACRGCRWTRRRRRPGGVWLSRRTSRSPSGPTTTVERRRRGAPCRGTRPRSPSPRRRPRRGLRRGTTFPSPGRERSWPRTSVGSPVVRHSRPPLANLSTASFFSRSTETTGAPDASPAGSKKLIRS